MPINFRSLLLTSKNIPNLKNYSVLHKTLIISRTDQNETEFVEFLTPTVDEEDAGVRVVGGGGSSGTMEARFVENM